MHLVKSRQKWIEHDKSGLRMRSTLIYNEKEIVHGNVNI